MEVWFGLAHVRPTEGNVDQANAGGTYVRASSPVGDEDEFKSVVEAALAAGSPPVP